MIVAAVGGAHRVDHRGAIALPAAARRMCGIPTGPPSSPPPGTRMATAWGTRPLDEISAGDIEAMQHRAAAGARSRRDSRHGRHAGEHVIAAARAIYNRAIADGHIAPGASPAHRVARPRRLPSTRRALTAHELDQVNATARTTGNDAVLDALLLRLHTETACRRGGALALRLADLDTDNRWEGLGQAMTQQTAAS